MHDQEAANSELAVTDESRSESCHVQQVLSQDSGEKLIADNHSKDQLRVGIFLGICAAVFYSGANLALRHLAVPNDPGWALWVTATKAIPTALLSWFLITLQWSKGQPALPPTRMIGRLVIVGLVMQYGGNYMFQWSLSLGGLAITVPICFSTLIITGAWVSRIVFGEQLSRRTMCSIGLLILSIVVLSSGAGSATQSMGHEHSLQTTMLAIMSAAVSGIAYGATGVVVRQLVTSTLTIPSSLVVLSTTGAVVMTTHAMILDGPVRLLDLSTDRWPMLIAAGVMNAAAFFAVAGSLKRLPVTFVNILNASQNAMCAVAGVLMFHEPLTSPLVGGCLVTIIGILLVDRGKVVDSLSGSATTASTD